MLATDGESVATMVRLSDHWLANTAKGAGIDEFKLNGRAKELARQTFDAVSGGLLSADLMETGDDYTVREANRTVEFKVLNDAVEADVPATVVNWFEAKIDGAQSLAEVLA